MIGVDFITDHAVTYFQNHHDAVMAFAGGVIISRPIMCATLVFSAVIRIPFIDKWVARNPETAKGWFNSFTDTIDKLVDKHAAKAKALAAAEAVEPRLAPPAPGAGS